MSERHRYLIALGSNVRHARHGSPRAVVAAALAALGNQGLALESASPTIDSAPLGPSRRRYANAAAIVSAELGPEALLTCLQSIEAAFGRRAGGRRWGSRVLDLDIVLWSGGPWASDRLVIPHPQFRRRAFVLEPAATIAAGWRDPLGGRTIGQLHTRLTRPRPLPSAAQCQATRLGP